MTGRPMSHRCTTCRRRKVKCDQGEPFCMRCLKAGLQCDGYIRDSRVFVNRSIESPPGTRQNGDGSPLFDQPKRRFGTVHSRYNNTERFRTHSFPLTTPSLSPSQEDIYMSFLTARIFRTSPPSSDQQHRDQSWIRHAIAEDPTSLSSTAANCLAAAYFGRLHDREPKALKFAVSNYGKALRLLDAIIKDIHTSQGIAVIASTLMLSWYEMISVTNGSGWVFHAGAVGQMIEARGVERNRQQPDQYYFILGRRLVIRQALERRKRTFLEQKQWKTVPWADDPDSKTSLQCLVDMFADIPGLLEDTDTFRESSDNQSLYPRQYDEYYRRIVHLLRDLFIWRWAWERSNPAGAYETPIDSKSRFNIDKKCLPAYQNLLSYEDSTSSTEIMLYDSIVLIILSQTAIENINTVLRSALSEFPIIQRPRSTNPLLLPSEDITVADVLSEICRSVEWHFDEPDAQNKALYVLLPIQMCLAELQDSQPEHAYLAAAQRRIGDTCGFELFRAVRN